MTIVEFPNLIAAVNPEGQTLFEISFRSANYYKITKLTISSCN